MKLFKSVSLETFTWIQRVQFWAVCVGMFATTYLLLTYTSGKPIVCGLVHGCEEVRASQWSHMFGVPLPFFGELYYFAAIALLLIRVSMPRFQRVRLRNFFLAMATAAFLESAWLTGLEAFVIRAYCIWCLISAAAATIIFVLAFFDTEILPDTKQMNRNMLVMFVSLLASVILHVVGLWWMGW